MKKISYCPFSQIVYTLYDTCFFTIGNINNHNWNNCHPSMVGLNFMFDLLSSTFLIKTSTYNTFPMVFPDEKQLDGWREMAYIVVLCVVVSAALGLAVYATRQCKQKRQQLTLHHYGCPPPQYTQYKYVPAYETPRPAEKSAFTPLWSNYFNEIKRDFWIVNNSTNKVITSLKILQS